MLDFIWERYKRYRFNRMVGGVVLAYGVLLFIGLKETLRCVHTLLGPATLSYAQATLPGTGLADRGYVRVTGVTLDTEHAKIVSDKYGVVQGAYVRVLPAAGAPNGVDGVVLWLPGDPGPPLASLRGAAEFTGWVDRRIDDHRTQLIKSDALAKLAGASGSAGWVVEINAPSWLQAGGLSVGGAVLLFFMVTGLAGSEGKRS